ncbi:MAG: hypothetical protein HFI22_01015 [Lachnospiraceae bacterium]|nr:hypothetical protein [Lachnospiraceae bacterium]
MGMLGSLQIVFGILYTLAMLIMSSALGIVCVKRNVFGIKDGIGKFCIGFSLAPVIIAIWMMAGSFLPSGAYKRYFVIFIPIILAILIVISNFDVITRSVNYILKLCSWEKVYVLALIAVLGIVGCKIWILTLGVQVQSGGDASFYMAESLKFAKSLSFRDIATHKDYLDGSLAGSPHNFIWPAYISYAHLFSNKVQSLGYDFAALLSMKYTLLYLIFVIFGVTHLILRKASYSLVSVLLFLMSPYRDYLLSSSRTFFRLIPVMLTLGVLYVIISSAKELQKGELLLIGILGFFAVSGHSVNIFFVLPVGLTGFILMLVNRLNWKTIISSIFAYVGGFAAGAYNIIYAYIDTGDLAGKCSLYGENIYVGTELEQLYLDNLASTMSINQNLSSLLQQIFSMDKNYLIASGIVASLLTWIICIFLKKYSNLLFFPTSNMVSFLMIVVGKGFRWGSFTFPEWLSRNGHYGYHYYILSIISIIICCMVLAELSKVRNKRITAKIKCTAAIILSLLTITKAFGLKIHSVIKADREYFAQQYQPVVEAQKLLSSGRMILTSGHTYAYHLNLEARLLRSQFGLPIYHAKNGEELLKYLKQENIEYVCLSMRTVNAIYQYAKFYTFMNDMDDIKLVYKNDNVELYHVLYN